MYINLLTQILNSQKVKKESIKFPYSVMDEKILDTLKKKGFVKDFDKKGKADKKYFEILLAYKEDKTGKINGVKFVTKPSRKIYGGYRDIKAVRRGHNGISVISTPKGIMTDLEAKRGKVGGAMLFEIW